MTSLSSCNLTLRMCLLLGRGATDILYDSANLVMEAALALAKHTGMVSLAECSLWRPSDLQPSDLHISSL